MSEAVINVTDLTRRFGAKTALASVSLSVPRGKVYGLVGANGAGKTTLIKHILGLLVAESGSVRVFGLDPVADPVGVLSRIGYLSEDPDLPGWMSVAELIRYSRAFYPGWDDAYAEELRRTFALDPSAKIKDLSKGQKARAGLLVALAYRPELLVLDEPSSGLDPIVRRDILGAVIRTIADEGRTVLFSSHLLDEVEQVADHVTMISDGKIVLSAPLDDICDRIVAWPCVSPNRGHLHRRSWAPCAGTVAARNGRRWSTARLTCKRSLPDGKRASSWNVRQPLMRFLWDTRGSPRRHRRQRQRTHKAMRSPALAIA